MARMGNRRRAGGYATALGPKMAKGRKQGVTMAMGRQIDAARAATGAPPTGQERGGPIRRRKLEDREMSPSGGGMSGNFQAGLGQQLSGRVSSGAIDQERAEQTAGERGILQQAYGKNWRQKVYGDRGYVKRVREALARDPENPTLRALYDSLVESRRTMLEKAKTMVGADV